MNIGEIKIMMKKFLKYQIPTNEFLNEVIDKIVVDKNKNIEIFSRKTSQNTFNWIKKEEKTNKFSSKSP